MTDWVDSPEGRQWAEDQRRARERGEIAPTSSELAASYTSSPGANYNDPRFNNQGETGGRLTLGMDQMVHQKVKGLPGSERGEYTAYRPDAQGFQLTGDFGGAAREVDRYRDMARGSDGRPLSYDMNSNANRFDQSMARNHMASSGDYFRSAMHGGEPSASAIGMRQAMAANNANAAAMSRGRGGAAQAIMASSPGQLAAVQAGAAGRSNEQMGATGAYGQVGGQMRRGDIAWEQQVSQSRLNERRANDARALAYEDMANRANRQQLAAQIEHERMKQEAELAQRGQNERVGARNSNKTEGLFNGVVGSIGKLFTLGL